jgi:hypothetical protein
LDKMLLNAIHGSNLMDRPRRSDAIPKHKRHKSDWWFSKKWEALSKKCKALSKKCDKLKRLSCAINLSYAIKWTLPMNR